MRGAVVIRYVSHDFVVFIPRAGFVNHYFVSVRKEGLERS